MEAKKKNLHIRYAYFETVYQSVTCLDFCHYLKKKQLKSIIALTFRFPFVQEYFY